MGGWPQTNETLKDNNETWISVLEKSRKFGFRSNYILSLYIDVDYKNTSQKLIHVRYLTFSLFNKILVNI